MILRVAKRKPAFDNVAELRERLGGIPLNRIRMQPPPGTATEKDVLRALDAREKRICELIDGVLVEKPMGAPESLFAMNIGVKITNYSEKHDLGPVLGADGTLRMLPGLVRIPDVSFISWDRIPGGEFPSEPIPDLVPDLAVEVISQGNTKKEMERKLQDYFDAGVRLVWLIYPKTQTAEVYTSPQDMTKVAKNGVLTASELLPGFRLPLKDVFTLTRRRRSGR